MPGRPPRMLRGHATRFGAARTVRTRVADGGRPGWTRSSRPGCPEALGRPLSRAAAAHARDGGRGHGRRPAPGGGPVPSCVRAPRSWRASIPSRLGPPAGEREVAQAFGPGRFLYRDALVLVVDKPAGLPMHATADASRPNLFDLVRGLLRGGGRRRAVSRAPPAARPGDVRRRPVHARPRGERAHRAGALDRRGHREDVPRACAPGRGSACRRPGATTGPLGGEGPLAAHRVLASCARCRRRCSSKRVRRRGASTRSASSWPRAARPILGDVALRRRRRRAPARDAPRASPGVPPSRRTGETVTVTSPYPPDFAALLATARALATLTRPPPTIARGERRRTCEDVLGVEALVGRPVRRRRSPRSARRRSRPSSTSRRRPRTRRRTTRRFLKHGQALWPSAIALEPARPVQPGVRARAHRRAPAEAHARRSSASPRRAGRDGRAPPTTTSRPCARARTSRRSSDRMKSLRDAGGRGAPPRSRCAEKDLITEGVAHDPKTGAFFVSSVRHRKIVRRGAGRARRRTSWPKPAGRPAVRGRPRPSTRRGARCGPSSPGDAAA